MESKQIAKSSKDWVEMLKDKPKELRVTGADNEANPTLEIALIMDCTSSMSSWIQKAKETLITIIDKIIQECKDEGNLAVRVSFVGYRDIKDGERFRVIEFTDDIQAVKNFIQATRAEGGADEPEDLQGGLKLALLQDWTEEATKRAFVIADAPCHGQKYNNSSDHYPQGSPDGLVLEDLMKEFCKKDIEFQFMKLAHNCDKMIEIMKQCHQEVEVTDMTHVTQTRVAPSRILATPESSARSYAAASRVGGARKLRGAIRAESSADFDCAELSSSARLSTASLKKAAPPKNSGGIFSSFFGKSKGVDKTYEMSKPKMMMKKKAMAPSSMSGLKMAEARELEAESCDMMMMKAGAAEEPPRDVFQDEIIKNTVMQVRKNQTTIRSKNAKF